MLLLGWKRCQIWYSLVKVSTFIVFLIKEFRFFLYMLFGTECVIFYHLGSKQYNNTAFTLWGVWILYMNIGLDHWIKGPNINRFVYDPAGFTVFNVFFDLSEVSKFFKVLIFVKCSFNVTPSTFFFLHDCI